MVKKDPLAVSVVALLIAVAGAKLWFAAHLGLHFDEAFLWHLAWRPALGFSNAPYLGGLLHLAGLWLLGDSALGLRLSSWLLGSSIPVAVYFLALPVVGRRDAIYAAGLTIAVPMLGLMGILSHEQFLFFAVAGLAAFERAVRTDRMRYWILAGLLLGLGLAIHHRMAMVGFALFVYLVVTPRGRTVWRRPGIYVAGAAALLLSLPTLIVLFQGDADAFMFQFFERHPWQFQPRQLLYPVIQMLVVTPPMFVLLAAALARAVGAARAGNDQAGLLAVFAVTILAFYVPMVTIADTARLNLHWVLPAYVPLLVFAPPLLRRFWRDGHRRVPGWLNRPLAALTPGLGIAVVVSAFVGLVVLSGPVARMPELLLRQTDPEFIGWPGFVAAGERFYRAFPGDPPIVVGSDYRVAARFGFGIGLRGDTYVLDLSGHNEREGAAAQYRSWRMDAAALSADRPGARALLILQDADYMYHSQINVAGLQDLCDRFVDFEYLGDYEMEGGHKYFRFFAASVRRAADPAWDPTVSCPTLPQAYIGQPRRGRTATGNFNVFGWAMAEPGGVADVEVLLDGAPLATQYGIQWTEEATLNPWIGDPRRPNVMFLHRFDPAEHAPGRHTLSIRVHPVDGPPYIYGTRTFYSFPP